MFEHPSRRVCCWAVVGACLFWGRDARADFPIFDFAVEQVGRHVELKAETIYHDSPPPYIPRCQFLVSRQRGGGEKKPIWRGDLGEGRTRCDEMDGGVQGCTRTCPVFVDPCPCPGNYTYYVKSEYYDPSPGYGLYEDSKGISVNSVSGDCVVEPGSVTATTPMNGPCDSGCGCRAQLGQAVAHISVLLIFLFGAVFARLIRRFATRRRP